MALYLLSPDKCPQTRGGPMMWRGVVPSSWRDRASGGPHSVARYTPRSRRPAEFSFGAPRRRKLERRVEIKEVLCPSSQQS